jgi:PBP1b-binding outer membrane lipoprotein LpoB
LGLNPNVKSSDRQKTNNKKGVKHSMKYFIALMLVVVMVGCSPEVETTSETVPADTTVTVPADTATVARPE